MNRLTTVVAVLALCVSCAKGTPTNPILPAGVSPTPLPQPEYVGIGRYQQLESVTMLPQFGGVPYVTFAEVRQAPESGGPYRDVPGFLFAYQGPAVLSRDVGETQSQTLVEPGDAKWVDSRSEYMNSSKDPATWYLVALRSVLHRGAQLPFPSYRILYETADLQQPPADQQLVFQLGYITMDVGGRSSSHSHGGTESFYVIKGTVELATNDGRRVNLSSGKGASVRPGVVMQLHVLGDEPVQILTLFVTPEGAPWQNNLQTLP